MSCILYTACPGIKRAISNCKVSENPSHSQGFSQKLHKWEGRFNISINDELLTINDELSIINEVVIACKITNTISIHELSDFTQRLSFHYKYCWVKPKRQGGSCTNNCVVLIIGRFSNHPVGCQRISIFI